MKINSLEINGYKNLNDIQLAFEEHSAVNAIIGNNGSGKSNILEAIVKIFSSVISNEELEFVFDIRYSIDNAHYQITNKENKFIFTKDGKTVKKQEIFTSIPLGIFLYYCGETDRLLKLSNDFVDKAFNKALKDHDEVVLKYLSFIELKDFPCALIANAAYKNSTYQKICDLIGIEEIGGPILLHLKRPQWSKSAPITNDSFWNAQGTVANLLHAFKDCGQLQITSKDSAVIRIHSLHALNDISENPFNLLTMFKLLMQANILESVGFDIIKDGKTITPDALSEGEKQLAQLLCFLEATKEYRALFLLDEFDSYLHPSWQRKFAEIIADIDIRGQVIFTTHSPLTIGKMKRENIRIIKDGQIYEPSVGTYNRDISEVLEEIMDVGLRPIEVQKCIDDFKSAAMFNKKEQALIHYETLKTVLSETDPFWNTANILLARLGD